VRAVGALGDDLLGDIVIAAMARHGVDTAGLIRKKQAQTSATILPIRPNGERPAFHVPGATRLFTRADVDLDAIQDSRALLIGAPDALAGLTGGDLADIAGAARSRGVLVAVDVLHPGRPEDLDRLAPLLAVTDWFLPNADQLLALTGRRDLGPAIKDVIALGTTAVAVTCGADGCLVAWPDSGGPVPLPALEVAVTDTTGCGDGFTAGLLTGLLLGPDPFGAGPARRRLARPRLRRPGRDRPGLGRRHREPGPGPQLSGAYAAGRGRPLQGRIRAGSRTAAVRSTSHE